MAPDPTAVVARALERWPELAAHGIAVEAAPWSDGTKLADALDRAAELYLARACVTGDATALRAFEAEFFAEVRACHARIGPRGLGLDELEQRVREKLFVKNAIAHFSGKGDLRRWLRVLTTRLIFDHGRAFHPEVSLEDQLLPDALDGGADAILAKAQLRAEIRAALGRAFSALTDRQKLLVQSEIRGTPLSAIAATYQVNVRSIQRWVREAHDAFLTEFRGALAHRLRVAPADLSSVLAFARSQLLSGIGHLGQDFAAHRNERD